ncbi:MAG: uroporphyrinogen-III C-methyltransferase [Burkholderiaceae bacterium]
MTGVSTTASPSSSEALTPTVAVTPIDPAESFAAQELRRLRRSVILWLVLGFSFVLLIAIALWFLTANRLDRSEREFARRIQDDGVASRSAQTVAKQAQDQSLANAAKVGALEGRVADSQSQQASLEQLYSDLARTRDDWALAEVEQILAVASQQLQLAGNVQGAIIALQNADQRLARTERPQFIVLRRAIAKDLERLKALPAVDIAGNALRIDSLVGMVDSLPLLADEKPAPRPRLDAQPVDRSVRADKPADKNGGTNSGATVGAHGWFERVQDNLRYLAAEAWQRFEQLVRVREVSVPDALLLAPTQTYFVRENLKLRLLNARLALLARQEATYRADLLRVQEALQKYFDLRSRQTQAALALLKQVQSANTVIEVPTLSESLTAARNVKGQR